MKIVIYTAITGKYDDLRQPTCIDERFDYICFSNEYSDNKIGIWEIRKIPIVINDNQRLSRYPKIKPNELLMEFDYSVYMDANLVIAEKEFYENILQLVEQNHLLAGVKNGWRDCLYDEGFRCILSKLDSASKIIQEMRFVRSEGFPRDYGMYEANIIFRNHHNETVIKQSNLWWQMLIKYARRDQLSFSYTMWKFNLPWCYIFPDGSNTHNNSNIIFHEHPHRILKVKKFQFRKTIKFLKPILYAIFLTIVFSINKK